MSTEDTVKELATISIVDHGSDLLQGILTSKLLTLTHLIDAYAVRRFSKAIVDAFKEHRCCLKRLQCQAPVA
jgi:hypothetical protein